MEQDKKLNSENQVQELALTKKIDQQISNQQLKFKKVNYLLPIILGLTITAIFLLVVLQDFLGSPLTSEDMLPLFFFSFLALILGFLFLYFRIRKQKKAVLKWNENLTLKLANIQKEAVFDMLKQSNIKVNVVKELDFKESEQTLIQLKKMRWVIWLNNHRHVINRIYPGFEFTSEQGITIKTLTVKVGKYHGEQFKLFNSSSAKPIFSYKYYFCALLLNDKWPDFNFILNYKNKWAIDNKINLENQYFNKKWDLETNDLVKIRRILTPFVQEHLTKTKIKNSLVKNKNQVYWFGHQPKDNFFSLKIPYLTNPKKIANFLAKDIINNVIKIEKCLSELVIYQELIQK